ncbi:PREDICTED: uncharacterized protein LOC104798429 [Tarenaya hassleriana]|uniref:uncharacterized protein LOC104798429 n=1 Tax=Tarenaya hassleriana TaxID=28532 RepID=UPI00053C25EA|nr:PREDICTED: uncharacterized protein LOC104798429 [Tarenaya hassleriana]
MENSNGGDIDETQRSCFDAWMSLQAQNMVDLKHALVDHRSVDQNHGLGHRNCIDEALRELNQKIVRDFEQYMRKRYELARRFSSPYFAPPWNSQLENALLWMGGCRPSSFIRLIYALCGAETEMFLSKFIDLSSCPNYSPATDVIGEVETGCSIGGLTTTQMRKLNDIHIATVQAEDKLTSRVASVQEDTSDKPAALVAYYVDSVGGSHEAVERALDKQEAALAEIVSEADKLRLSTMKSIIGILSTVQASDFLFAAKKLHLSMHEWGSLRDRRRRNVCAFAGEDGPSRVADE